MANRGASAVTKGKRAERQIAAILQDDLNRAVEATGYNKQLLIVRNTDQARDGGVDLVVTRKGRHEDLFGWFSVEIKDHNRLNVLNAWQQCVEQADARAGQPYLIYKSNRQWFVKLLASPLWQNDDANGRCKLPFVMDMDLMAFKLHFYVRAMHHINTVLLHS